MNPLAAVVNATKDVSGEFRAFMGIPDSTDSLKLYRTLKDYATAPADEAWVQRCVSILSSGAAGVPLKVYVRQPGGSLALASDVADPAANDLQFLLDNINGESMSGSDFKGYTTAGKSIWGEAHWKRVRGRLGGPTQELYWLPAPDLKPIMGRTWIDHYEYRPSSPAIGEDIKVGNILSFRNVNLGDPTRGLSPIAAVRYELNVNSAAAQHTAYTLANWGIPPGAWIIPQNADFTTQDKSLVRRALRALRGPRGAGRIPVLPQGLTWQALALNPKDAEWLAARKVSRMTICAALGVPLVLAGDDEKTTVYANLRDAERVMWRMRLIPELDAQADVINNWLVPEFDPTRRRLTVGFDYTGIEALRPVLTEEMKAWTMFLNHTVVTPNETRRYFRLGPDVPWGDEPVALNTVIPYSTEEPLALPETPLADDLLLEGASENAVAHFLRQPGLYRNPAVRAYLDGGELDATALLGEPASPETRALLGTGLRRRYAPGQIARGVPSEGYPGLVHSNGAHKGSPRV